MEDQKGRKEHLFVALERLGEVEEDANKIENRLRRRFEALGARPADQPLISGLERVPARDASEIAWARTRFDVNSLLHPTELAAEVAGTQAQQRKLLKELEVLAVEETAVLQEIRQLEKINGLQQDLDQRLKRVRNIQRRKAQAERELDSCNFRNEMAQSRQRIDLLQQLESGRGWPGGPKESWLLHSLVKNSAHQQLSILNRRPAVRGRSVPIRHVFGQIKEEPEPARQTVSSENKYVRVELPTAEQRVLRYKTEAHSKRMSMLKDYFLSDWRAELATMSKQHPTLPRYTHEVMPLLEARQGDLRVEVQVKIPITMVFDGSRYGRFIHNNDTDKILSRKAEEWESLQYIMNQLKERTHYFQPHRPEYIIKRLFKDGEGIPLQAMIPVSPIAEALIPVAGLGSRHPPTVTGTFWETALPLCAEDVQDILSSLEESEDGTVTLLQRFIPSLQKRAEVLRIVQTEHQQRRFLIAASQADYSGEDRVDTVARKLAISLAVLQACQVHTTRLTVLSVQTLHMEDEKSLDTYRIEELPIVRIVDGHAEFESRDETGGNFQKDYRHSGGGHSDEVHHKIAAGDEEHPWANASRVLTTIWDMLCLRGESLGSSSSPQERRPARGTHRSSNRDPNKATITPRMIAADFMLDTSSQVVLLQIKEVLWKT